MGTKEELSEMEEWQSKFDADIRDVRQEQNNLRRENRDIREDIQELKMTDRLHDREIKSLKDSLLDIKSDTQWIRRKITGAIITAVVTAAIGTIIAYAVSQLWGG